MRDQKYIEETRTQIIADVDALSQRMQITASKKEPLKPNAIDIVAKKYRLSYITIRDIYYPRKHEQCEKLRPKKAIAKVKG